MLIDTEHLHFWMQAIRQSENPIRTMDAFWSGQLKSKEWLIDNLSKHIHSDSDVDIHGGWVGVLASMLFQSAIPITRIRSIDIDPSCESISTMMNKKEEIEGRFVAVTSDMCEVDSTAAIVINTSCEHITQEQYNDWLDNVPESSLVLVQSNNYEIPEHIRIANDLDEFRRQSRLQEIWSGKLELPLYTRYMVIGTRIKTER